MQVRNPEQNLKGIDVSHYQGSIDFGKVKADGVQFVYVKLTDKDNFVDPMAENNIVNAKAAGLKVGVYHFGRFTDVSSAQKEAQWFLSHVKDYDLDLPHVLDLEVNEGKISKVDLSKAALTWFEVVGKDNCMIYSGESFANSNFDETLKDIPLWVAHYGVNQPNNASAWDKWTVFQYSSTGSVSGINGNVDMDEAVDGFFDLITPTSPAPSNPKKESVVKRVIKEVEKIIHHKVSYSVKSGDTLISIAAQFNTTVDQLVKDNKISNPNKIYVGQLLHVGTTETVKQSAPSKSSTYTVKSGDSLSKIASDHGMSLAEIEKLNPQISDPNVISVGEKINLSGQSTKSESKVYTVVDGDTLSEICAKHNVNMNVVVKLNGISDPSKIYVGQKIKLN